MTLNEIKTVMDNNNWNVFMNTWYNLGTTTTNNMLKKLQEQFINAYMEEDTKLDISEVPQQHIENYLTFRLINIFQECGYELAFNLRIFVETNASTLGDNQTKTYNINQKFSRGYQGYNTTNRNNEFRSDLYTVTNNGSLQGKTGDFLLGLFKSEYKSLISRTYEKIKEKLFIDYWE